MTYVSEGLPAASEALPTASEAPLTEDPQLPLRFFKLPLRASELPQKPSVSAAPEALQIVSKPSKVFPAAFKARSLCPKGRLSYH